MARTWLSIEFIAVQARPRRRSVGTATLSSAAPRPDSDGHYDRLDPTDRPFNLHRYFMTNPSLSGRGAALDSVAVPTLRLRGRA